MIKNEIIRYYKSKINIILTVILSLIVAGCYYTTYIEKTEWIKVYESNASDVDLEKVQQVIDGYSTIGYFEKFIFSSDFFVGFWIIVIIGFGISVGSIFYDDLKSNYGTLIMSRTSYRRYLKDTLIAKAIYMMSYLTFFIF